MTDPDVKVSGDADAGWIVETHDGDRHMAAGVMAADEDAARAAGLKRFQAEAPEVVPPPATVAHVEQMVARFEAMLKDAETRMEARIMAMLAPKPALVVTSGGTSDPV